MNDDGGDNEKKKVPVVEATGAAKSASPRGAERKVLLLEALKMKESAGGRGDRRCKRARAGIWPPSRRLRDKFYSGVAWPRIDMTKMEFVNVVLLAALKIDEWEETSASCCCETNSTVVSRAPAST